MAKELKPRTQLSSYEISKVLSGMFTTAKTIVNKKSIGTTASTRHSIRTIQKTSCLSNAKLYSSQ